MNVSEEMSLHSQKLRPLGRGSSLMDNHFTQYFNNHPFKPSRGYEIEQFGIF